MARCVDCAAATCAACRSRLAGRSRCPECHRAALEAVLAPRRRPPLLAAAAAGITASFVLLVLGAGRVGATLRTEARVRQAREALERVRFALDDLYLDLARYPAPEEGLDALLTADPEGDAVPLDDWRGPYLVPDGTYLRHDRLRGELLDAWGNPIRYARTPDERRVFLISAGPDGRLQTPVSATLDREGTASGDDILVWVERRP